MRLLIVNLLQKKKLTSSQILTFVDNDMGVLLGGGFAYFLESLPLVFQSGQSAGLAAVYHFTFTGAETHAATVVIKDGQLTVEGAHRGDADLHVIAGSTSWVGFLAKEVNLVKALLTRKIRIKGSPRLMKAFAKCFPS